MTLTFKNTGEALLFGENATDVEREQLLSLRKECIKQYYILVEDGEEQEASIIACQGQLYREALEASDEAREYPFHKY